MWMRSWALCDLLSTPRQEAGNQSTVVGFKGFPWRRLF